MGSLRKLIEQLLPGREWDNMGGHRPFSRVGPIPSYLPYLLPPAPVMDPGLCFSKSSQKNGT